MNRKRVKAAVIVLAVVICLLVVGIWALAYLKTGRQFYDTKNLDKCLHYSNEQAKEKVLQAWLKHQDRWRSWEEAKRAADQQGITFMDAKIQGPAKVWLIPFTVSSKPDKTQYGMLDGGTLTVKFSED